MKSVIKRVSLPGCRAGFYLIGGQGAKCLIAATRQRPPAPASLQSIASRRSARPKGTDRGRHIAATSNRRRTGLRRSRSRRPQRGRSGRGRCRARPAPPMRAPPWHETAASMMPRSEEHTSELQSRQYLVCRLLLEKKKKKKYTFSFKKKKKKTI